MVDPMDVNKFPDLCDDLDGPFESCCLLPMWVKYVCCVRTRDLVMKPKIIDGHPKRSMSQFKVRFEHCGR